MESFYFFTPHIKEKTFENSPLRTRHSLPDISDTRRAVRRNTLINEICRGENKTYITEYPHIVKFCRACITDVCRELTELSNWETTRYKKYTELLKKLSDNYDYPINDREELIKDLQVNICDAKRLYTEYRNFWQQLQSKKLYTKGCIVCVDIKAL